MTFQIGLVGRDGSVIASDTFLQQTEYGARSIGTISKFLSSQGVLCCWSGDAVAQHAASIICGLKWPDIEPDKEGIEEELERAGDRAWAEMERSGRTPSGITRKVIVACHDMLMLLEVGLPSSVATQRRDRVVAGDAENTARHFINKYAHGCQNLPVKQLIRLAAYAVFVAGQENPHGVRGVEVVVIPNGGPPVFLSKEQEQELQLASERLNTEIRNELLRAFDFAEGPT